MPQPQDLARGLYWKYLTDQFDDNSFVRIGTITGPHGLDGKLKVFLHTHVRERFSPGQTVHIKAPDGFYDTFRIAGFTAQEGKPALLDLETVTGHDQAVELKGRDVFIPLDEAESSRSILLDEDSFYYYDLIGCRVFLNGAEFGTVKDIMEAGAGDILVIRDQKDKQHLVPFVTEMVDVSRISQKELEITPVEGLLED